jgi:hypothetical protein
VLRALDSSPVTEHCRYYVAVCFPQLFEHSSAREDVVARAMSLRIKLGHHVLGASPAMLLKQLLEIRESKK